MPAPYASRGEVALHQLLFGSGPASAVLARAGAELPQIARMEPRYRTLCATLDGLFAFQRGDAARGRELLAWVFATGDDPAKHPFVERYLTDLTISVAITDEVSVELPVSRDTVGLAVAEIHQEAGDLDVAIATVELCEPTSITALSLADLYNDTGRHADVVDTTNGLTNLDDATALLLVLRGRALREQGYHDAAREAFKEALRVRTRAAPVRHRALLERALGYLATRKVAMARKDLERILAEDSTYPGLQEALAQLPT